MGRTPLALWLPAGAYRVGGASDELRVPSFRIDLQGEGRSVVLDFALAESLRVNAGPGLALAVARRGDGIVRAGAWLGVDRVIAVCRVFEGEAAFLLGSIYDVRRGALLREGSVRMVAGSVPAANLGALAAFLLTGQSSRDVKDRTQSARERMPVAAAPEPAALEATSARSGSSPDPDLQARRAAPVPTADGAARAPPAAAAVPVSARQIAKDGRVADASAAKPQDAPARPRDASASRAPASAPLAAPAEPGVAEALSLAAAPPSEATPAAAGQAVKAPRARRGWMRRGALGSAIVAGGFAALGLQQGLAARSAYADASAMVADGVFIAGSSASDVARYHALRDDGDAAKRNAYLSAGAAVVFAATAGVLGWKSMGPAEGPAIAFRF
jgi:hypothetical protein